MRHRSIAGEGTLGPVSNPTSRYRFAPSPTGFLHLGSARAALFNWLAARHEGGQFLLRIEDTDRERSRPELIDLIFRTLRWLGMDWDEEPTFQSHRSQHHHDAVARLLAEGRAYWCDCTPEALRARAQVPDGKSGYDGHCRERDLGEGPGRVVRFQTPDQGETAFSDVIRGDVAFPNADLEDFVIVRSSGSPLFLVANTVDDIDMGITHVVRGEDLLNATPKTVLLRRALGHDDLPVFAHLPLIVNESRQKLSKRRDDVAVEDYIERGFLPEAMANYLATLGWGPPDGVEIRPMTEIVELFRLEDVTGSSAFFDQKKLAHFNGEYIRAMDAPDFVEVSRPFLHTAFGEGRGDAALDVLAPLVQERVTRLDEVPGHVDFLVEDVPRVDEAAWAKVMAGSEVAAALLDDAVDAYATCEWDTDTLHETTRAVGERHGLKLGKATGPIRVAVSGRSVGPPLFESLEFLGREQTLQRLRAARARL